MMTNRYPGQLDPSFGANGQLRFDLLAEPSYKLHILPDGSFLSVGVLDWVPVGRHTVTLARRLPDGSLDTGFGYEGTLTFDIDYPETFHSVSSIMGEDNSLVISVRAGNVLLFIKLTNTYSLDSSFGSGGSAVVDLPKGTFDIPGAMAPIPGGGTVAAAMSRQSHTSPWDAALFRLTARGAVDTSFADAGFAHDFPPNTVVNTLIRLADGRLLVGGASTGRAMLARFLSDGRLDQQFGSGGYIFLDMPQYPSAIIAHASVQADGKIVVGGHAGGEQTGFLARLEADGSALDPGFNSGNVFFTPPAEGAGEMGASVQNVTVLPDGKILALQASFLTALAPLVHRVDQAANPADNIALASLLDTSASPKNMPATATTLWRFRADGTPDTQFGQGGSVTVRPDSTYFDLMHDMAVQPDGKYLVLGRTISAAESTNHAMFRFLPD